MHHTLVKAPLLHPPLSAESQHHSLTTHILTCLQTPSQTCIHTSTCAHIQNTYTSHPSHYGDKSCLSWLPSVSHGVVYESNSPVICLSQMNLQGVQGLVWWLWLQDCLDSNLLWSGSRTDTYCISQALRCKGATIQQRGQVNHHSFAGFNPLKHEFTLT